MLKKEESLEIVLNALKEGKSIVSIAKELGMGKSTIHKYKEELIKDGRITQVEIDEINKRKKQEAQPMLQPVLEMLREGKSQATIARELGITPSKVYKYKEQLIKDKRITQEEIDKASKPEEINKEEECFQRIKEGKSLASIARELGMAESTIHWYKTRLIKKGKITQAKIDEINKRKKEEGQLMLQLVLEMLREGKSQVSIAEVLGVSADTVYEYKLKLIKEQRITQSEIDEASNLVGKNKEEEYLQAILKMLREGKDHTEIAEELGVAKVTVGRYKLKLIQSNRITQEEVNEAKRKRKEADNEDKYLNTILGMLKDGKSDIAICKALGMGNEKLKKYKLKLIQIGKITQEEIDEIRLTRSEDREEKRRRFILSKLELGYSYLEIVSEYREETGKGINLNTIGRYKNELVSRGLITEEEIKAKRNVHNQNCKAIERRRR